MIALLFVPLSFGQTRSGSPGDQVAVPARPVPSKPDPTALHEVVAMVHAPIHYQDTDRTCAAADYLTAFDYDGDTDPTDNWDDFEAFDDPLVGTVYWSVTETCTHWFVVYAMFHPRDWDDGAGGFEHENDFEGALAVVEKDGVTGVLRAMITIAHWDFYSYVPAGSPYVEGAEDIDGTLSFGADGSLNRPLTSQEAKGHGLGAWPYFGGGSGEAGVVYYPGYVGEIPESADDDHVGYELVPLWDALWPLQLTASAGRDHRGIYAGWGALSGDDSGTCGNGAFYDCSSDAAELPWAWNDWDDGLGHGLMALDPASLVAAYFSGVGADFSSDYVSNRYLEDLRDEGWSTAHPPPGWPEPPPGYAPLVDLDALYTHLDADCG